MALPQTGGINPSHLGPNNFTIGHDSRMTESSLMSVFKNDYPVHNAYGRADIAKPPRLGDVMHKDERYIRDCASETVTSFQYRPMAKAVLIDVQNTLRMTNFKMDSDVSKVNSFATTHDHYYQPKYLPLAKRSGSALYTSHIPDGDRGKADTPITNYHDKFPGHDPRKHPTIKAPSMHQVGPPTIKGDGFSVEYDTSNNDQFQGRWTLAPPACPKIKNSHIFPQQRNQTYFNTTHNDLFTPKTSEKYSYDRGRMQKSSVPLGTFES